MEQLSPYFTNEYITPVEVDRETIRYRQLDMTNLLESERIRLAQMYQTIYNLDNKRFASDLGRKGIWDEEPWSFEASYNKIMSWQDTNTTVFIAEGFSKYGTYMLLGLNVIREMDVFMAKKKGINIPIDLPYKARKKDARVIYINETLRREVVDIDGKRVGKIGENLRNYSIENVLRKSNETRLLCSRTQNPRIALLYNRYGWISQSNIKTNGGIEIQGFYPVLSVEDQIYQRVLEKAITKNTQLSYASNFVSKRELEKYRGRLSVAFEIVIDEYIKIGIDMLQSKGVFANFFDIEKIANAILAIAEIVKIQDDSLSIEISQQTLGEREEQYISFAREMFKTVAENVPCNFYQFACIKKDLSQYTLISPESIVTNQIHENIINTFTDTLRILKILEKYNISYKFILFFPDTDLRMYAIPRERSIDATSTIMQELRKYIENACGKELLDPKSIELVRWSDIESMIGVDQYEQMIRNTTLSVPHERIATEVERLEQKWLRAIGIVPSDINLEKVARAEYIYYALQGKFINERFHGILIQNEIPSSERDVMYEPFLDGNKVISIWPSKYNSR